MIGRVSGIAAALLVFSLLGWQGLVGMIVGGAIFQIAYRLETGFWYD